MHSWAEVATLYLLGIGNLAEPYYWIFIVLTAISFVLICFLLVRLVAPLKDVLHLSFHPIGAGVFAGAFFALLASAVVALLIVVGFIPEIKYDLTQWGNDQQVTQVLKLAVYDCLKQESLLFQIVASGMGEAYTKLKAPIDDLSYIRPLTTVLYLLIAARVFMVAVDHRKPAVFGLVVLGALISTVAIYQTFKAYGDWTRTSDCLKDNKVVQGGWDRYGESALKEFARGMNQDNPTTIAQLADGCVSRCRGSHTQLQLSFQASVAQFCGVL